MTDRPYDVVIVGGGMVGAVLASALAPLCRDQGLRIAVVESALLAADQVPAQPAYDARSTALSASTVHALQALALWPELQAAATPIEHIHVSDQGQFATTRLHARDYGLQALGYVVENRALGAVFNRRLRQLEGVEIIDGAQAQEARPLTDGYRLTLSHDQISKHLRTRLLVLAEGGRSGLAMQLGIHRRQYDYEQSAIIANLSTERAHGQVAWERFTPQGPLALLPLSPYERRSRSALVWTRQHEEAQRLMALSPQDFCEALQADIGFRLGRVLQVGERQCFPLFLQEAEEKVRPGLVLLGNLAHTLHPVAGQGFNLAVRTALALADTLRQAVTAGDSPGAVQWLHHFVDGVEQDQQRTVQFSDTLTRLFSSTHPATRCLRQGGMLGLDLLPPARDMLARTAMGMGVARVAI